MEKKVYPFNTSGVVLMFSINDGDFIRLPSTSSSFHWMPVPASNNLDFYNQYPPPKGGLGLGINVLTLYPASSGPKYAGAVNIVIPENISITSVQLYLYWRDATQAGAVICNSGQYIQAVGLP